MKPIKLLDGTLVWLVHGGIGGKPQEWFVHGDQTIGSPGSWVEIRSDQRWGGSSEISWARYRYLGVGALEDDS